MVIEKGAIDNISAGPRQAVSVTLPVKSLLKEGKEYFLDVHYNLKRAEPFLEPGYEIAYEQFALGKQYPPMLSVGAKGNVTIIRSANLLLP